MVLFVADITLLPPPGVAKTLEGGTAEFVLASVAVYPISTVEFFVSQLDPETGQALRDGWGNRYSAASPNRPLPTPTRAMLTTICTSISVYQTLSCPGGNSSRCRTCEWPTRSSTLDVVDLVASFPVELRADKSLYRQAIAETLPGVLDVPVSHGGWNPPDWAGELRANAGAITDVLRSPSRLDELIPPQAIVRLLEAGLTPTKTRGDNAVTRVRASVRGSAPLRRVVRAVKPKVQPGIPRRRPWERLMLDLLSLRGFLAKVR